MQNSNGLKGASVKKFLGTWCVDEITEGSEGISGAWANIGKHITLYARKDGVVLGFTEPGFCTESYDPFWFKYCKTTQLLCGLGRDGVVEITVGFIGNQIAFQFRHANGDSFTQDGTWKGSGGNN